MPILYAFTLFVSASLLFMVQPMIGRMILPLLGGSPAAWNTCMVFFQTVLLLGYLYAHKLTAKLAPRKQVGLHLAVLGGAVGVMLVAAVLGAKGSPIPVVEALAPDNTAYPMFGVLALLAVAIGVPFFAVSTSAPLLQRWFAYSGHAAARDPYFLYAASNAGSLLSLLGYPLVTEPSFTLAQQAWLFAGGFVVLVALVAACGKTVRPAELAAVTPAAPPEPPPPLARRLRWLGLAFVPSSLMLGVTTHMTTDLASIPLLWVGPLALYLVTFIIAFAKTPGWVRPVLGNITPVVTLLLVFVLLSGEGKIENVFYLLLLHLVTYFLIALLCHSELARDRPSTAYLTTFYLWLSLGGMLGGVFNALLAPLLFSSAWEYPIAIAVGCLLIPKLDDTPTTPEQEGRGRMVDFAVAAVMLLAVAVLTALPAWPAFGRTCFWLAQRVSELLQFAGVRVQLKPDRIRDFILFALPAMACFFFIDRPVRFGLCVAALLFVGYYRHDTSGITDHARSFFGIMKVEDEDSETDRLTTEDGGVYDITHHLNRRRLVHGTTLHGIQSTTEAGVPGFLKLAPLSQPSQRYNGLQLIGGAEPWSLVGKIGLWTAYDYKREPLTYYGRTGPVGHIFDVTNSRHPRADFGMVGLGTGSVACYAAAGQTVTFYEIDPDVVRLVDDGRNFTFIKDARARGATVRYQMGDARLKLQAEPDTRYPLLLVDAFSSDSIPIHLLTQQAVDLYLNRVTDDGIVALHISNRYIKLELAVAKIAAELGAASLIFEDNWTDNLQEFPPGKSQSTWVVLARRPETLAPFLRPQYATSYRPESFDREPIPNRWGPMKLEPRLRVWTDDYADVLSVMRIKEVAAVRGWFGLPTFE